MQSETKPNVQKRLKRIAGQVAGLQKMIDEDRYCVDVLTQVAAVRSALDAVGVLLLTDHIEGCLVGHGTGSEHHCAKAMSQNELLEEVRTALGRFLR
ncbi:MAG: metal-sensitive transcriptional regulator [Planctomycetota bacterium]|nr:metal-sensitive transcriptional regulator [Planctomycetaceae bacterium]MDQ3333422.1 metal-sensitive transcriptional regulator [Planctomycetota bacterium]